MKNIYLTYEEMKALVKKLKKEPLIFLVEEPTPETKGYCFTLKGVDYHIK